MKNLVRNPLLATLVALSTTTAIAQDKPVELKFAHWLPAQHSLATTGFIPWAKSVESASGGSIKVNLFPAQQLGKAADHYDMARDGIASMTWVSPGYQAGRFPVFAASELPFLMDKTGPASAALDTWYRAYADKEMKDVRLCFAHVHVGTLHSKQPITQPAQIRSMKIRPANGTVAQMVTALGGTNVQVSALEARDALEKGVADAITFPWNSTIAFGIDKAVKFHADMRLYAASFVWVMNRGWYDSLSAGQKKVMDSHCNGEWAARVGKDWGGAEDEGRAKLAATTGHTLVALAPEQIDAWKKAVQPVQEQWIASTSKSGVDARKVLEDLRAQLVKAGGNY